MASDGLGVMQVKHENISRLNQNIRRSYSADMNKQRIAVTCTVQIALYKLHCTTCTVQIALYKLHCTNCTVQIALYKLHCTNCTVQIALYKLHCTNCTVQKCSQLAPINCNDSGVFMISSSGENLFENDWPF